MKMSIKVEALERMNVVFDKRLARIEYLIWYVTISLSVQYGKEILPIVAALIK